MTTKQDIAIHDEWARKDAHYAANPIDPPRARDGTLLTIGQRVQFECVMDGPEGIITELTIRCYGHEGMDNTWFRVEAGIVEPMQQVWIFLNGRNCIHRPTDIIRVIEHG